MNIVFLMRYDFREKSGGDVVQIKAYSEELCKLGHNCVITNEVIGAENCDVIFLVNIDRPIETIYNFKKVKSHFGAKQIYIVPIHHPLDVVTKFERLKKGLVYKLLCIIFPDFYVREKIKNLVRFRLNAKLFSISLMHLFISYRRAIEKMLSEATGIVFISQLEMKAVQESFSGIRKPLNFTICPNAVSMREGCADLRSSRDRKFDIILVGRIEERKNQLELLRYLIDKPYSVSVLGPKNENSLEYGNNVISLIEKRGDWKYLGSVPHSSVLEHISNAKILINPSYFEVSPLVDIEALRVGTFVLTTKNSRSDLVLNREKLRCTDLIDPWNFENLDMKINKFLEQSEFYPSMEELNQIECTWESSVKNINNLLTRWSV